MAHSTLRPVSCASQGRLAVDRVAGLLLGVEPPTVSLTTGTSVGADDGVDGAGTSERFGRRERMRLARHLRQRRRARIIVRRGV